MYIGVTLAIFQSSGKIPVLIERLTIKVKEGTITGDASFNNLVEIPSRPHDLFSGRAFSNSFSLSFDIWDILKECSVGLIYSEKSLLEGGMWEANLHPIDLQSVILMHYLSVVIKYTFYYHK